MAHCLSEWAGEKHSGIVWTSEGTQHSPSQTRIGCDLHPQDVCEQNPKIQPMGARSILPHPKEADFALLYMRCNLSGEMCGFLSDHRELDLGSPRDL